MTTESNIYFDLTHQHIKLLRHMWVEWQGDEFGAPAIDPKRPYGNSDVYEDIAEILGDPIPDADSEGDGFDTETLAYYDNLHKETQTALQIVLRTGEMKVGRYVADKYSLDWRAA